ncbi:MAG: hypothetical protein ACTS9Y_00455 [Methylophilus sp.]|uniref:hypothetical protein n=1 Tax=Methylophilus sp. TaxID=29541 RepID=UPI003FA003D2
MNTPAEQNNIDRVEKFQSLQSGQFWRAMHGKYDGINEGFVLMIQSIKYVDERPHTIILRTHPSIFGQYVQVGGPESKTSRVFREHPFLLAEFLDNFQFEENPDETRNRELLEIQNRAGLHQKELMEAQTNPTILNAIVESRLSSEGSAGLPAISAQNAHDFVRGGVAGAISTGITPAAIEGIKLTAQREHKIATIKADWIKGATAKISSTLAEMTPYFEEKAALALAQTEDIRTYVDKLMKGIESLDLYVGKNVHVNRLKSGSSAASDIPLTFVQRKLMMDEELASHLDIEDWFDFSKHRLFFAELEKNIDLVNQIFPTERCILVMATTNHYKNYSDNSYVNAMMNEENQKVFMLARDGDNLFQIVSPIESHLGTSRLFPSKSDQDSIFRGIDGSEISFESIAYTNKLSQHEAHALHYKRFLIMVCGLDHRENLFGKFYEGPKNIDFISMKFQETHCSFLHDDDGEGMLPNPDVRPDVIDWAFSHNRNIRHGSRFIADWFRYATSENCPILYSRSRHNSSRINKFTEDVSVKVVYRKANELFIEVPATSHWNNNSRVFNANIKLRLEDLKSESINGLCIDAVEPSDIEYYIHHRGSRKNHVQYIRFFKLMLGHIKAEREAEAKTRAYLLESLEVGKIGSPGNRQSIVSNTVAAWRAENNGKPLPVVGECSSKDIKSLLNHMAAVTTDNSHKVEAVKAFVIGMGHELLKIALNGKSEFVAYTKAKPEQFDNVLEDFPFVNKLTLSESLDGFTVKSETMDVLRKMNASEKGLYDSPDISQFYKNSVFTDYKVKERFMKMLDDGVQVLKDYSKALSPEQFKLEVYKWGMERSDLSKGQVVEPLIFAPIGGYYDGYISDGNVRLNVIYLSREHAGLLYHLAPNEECREEFRVKYIKIYQDKKAANRFFNQYAEKNLWNSCVEAVWGVKPSSKSWHLATAHEEELTHEQFISRRFEYDFDKKTIGVKKTYLHGGLAVDGKCVIDQMYGTKIPENYELHTIAHVKDMSSGKTVYFSVAGKFDAFRSVPSDLMRDKFGFSGFSAGKSIYVTRKARDEAIEQLGFNQDEGIEIDEQGIKGVYFQTANADVSGK